MSSQLFTLFILALPIACIAWTLTHEELFRELHHYCESHSKSCRTLASRKFFYVFTCEYCFSHYVALVILAITRFHLLWADWRGYLVAGFSLVWIANIYMSIYGRLRLDIQHERVDIAADQQALEKSQRRPMARAR
jgi:membrane protein required for beta-lactamase induction